MIEGENFDNRIEEVKEKINKLLNNVLQIK